MTWTSKAAVGDVDQTESVRTGGSVAQPVPFHASRGKNESKRPE